MKLGANSNEFGDIGGPKSGSKTMNLGHFLEKTRFLARAEIHDHFSPWLFCYRGFSFGVKKSAFLAPMNFQVFSKNESFLDPEIIVFWVDIALMGRYPLGGLNLPKKGSGCWTPFHWRSRGFWSKRGVQNGPLFWVKNDPFLGS